MTRQEMLNEAAHRTEETLGDIEAVVTKILLAHANDEELHNQSAPVFPGGDAGPLTLSEGATTREAVTEAVSAMMAQLLCRVTPARAEIMRRFGAH